MRIFARAALVGLVLTHGALVVSPAAAQAAAADDAAAEAKRHFESGLEHYKANRYTDALKEFTEANRLSPRATLQRNVAQTQRDLGDFTAAYESYEKLLSLYGSSLKPDEKAAAEKARDELATLTGEVAIFVNVPDAVVLIDGQERGAPPTTIRANNGSHRVVVRAPGYRTLEQTVDLKGRDKVAVSGPLEGLPVDPTPAPPVKGPPQERIEPPPVVSTAELEKWKGVYARFELAGVFPTGHHDSISDQAVYGAAVPVSGSGLYGGGAGVRVGYSFGHFGVEGVLNAAYDHASVSANLGARKDNWNFYRGGAVVGVAGRFHPHLDELGPVRPTAGFALGLAGRAVGYQRLVENTTSKDKASFEFYMAPSMIFDIGVTIGNQPGTKFYVGFMAMLEFPAGITLPSGNSKDGQFPIPSTARVEAANGVELFIGPTIGLAFGH